MISSPLPCRDQPEVSRPNNTGSFSFERPRQLRTWAVGVFWVKWPPDWGSTMIRLTNTMGGDAVWVHPGHVLTVEAKGSGSEIELSNDKKIDVDESPDRVAICVANSISWYFTPRVTDDTRTVLRDLGYGVS